MFEAEDIEIILIALDLCDVLDIIDHSNFLSSFGVTGPARSWISSYLAKRTTFVKIGNASSAITLCNIDVSLCSVLGSLLFSLSTTPHGGVISAFDVKCHRNSDDTQTYFAIDKEYSF